MPDKRLNGFMATKIPYDTSADALLNPAKGAKFFDQWETMDFENHDLLCAEMSRLAYANQEDVTRALDSTDFAPIGFIGGDDPASRIELFGTQGFVAKSRTRSLTILAFRGTESGKFEDLISDLDTLQRDFRDGCRVHSGFLKAYGQLVKERVASLLQAREGSLLVTGHSLGAALATLAALDTQPAALITFGSPRVGDAQFKRLLNGLTVHRFVNCCDVVTRVPPRQFVHDDLLQLLTELGDFDRFPVLGRSAAKAAAELAAIALATAFHGIASKNQFTHVSSPRYVRANGRVADAIDKELMAQDQQDARIAYRHQGGPGREQLQEIFEELRAQLGGKPMADLCQLLRTVVRALFNLIRGDPVPLRDLADHAPINYVSAFTGRT